MVMEEINLRNFSYLGDAVWELHIRKKTIIMTNNSKKLHEITTAVVKGSFQAELLNKLDKILTEEEKEIARRGRNLPIPVGRRANQTEYRQATAFETLIGWWFQKDQERYKYIIELIDREYLLF